MHIQSITLHNVRAFGPELELSFSTLDNGPRKATVLIGSNGTCKTTLLRAIALGLGTESDAAGLLAEDFGSILAEDADEGEITIGLQDPQSRQAVTITTQIKRENGHETIAKQDRSGPLDATSVLVCGYGVLRGLTGGDSARPYRVVDSVYSLFNYEAALMDTELALRRFRDYLDETESYTSAEARIKTALGLMPSDHFDFEKGGGIIFSGKTIGYRIPLQALADGYKMSFVWIMDFFGWAMRAGKLLGSGDVEAIILIDELEQHWHPRMQTELVSRLAKLLPGVQLICTTHSPLVALGAGPESVMQASRKGARVVVESAPDFAGASAEDILVDDRLFGTSPYDKKTDRLLAQYRRLAGKEHLAEDEKEKLGRLTCQLDVGNAGIHHDEDLKELLKKLAEIEGKARGVQE